MIKRIFCGLSGFENAGGLESWVRNVLLADVDARKFLRYPKTAIAVHVLYDGQGEKDSEVKYVIISDAPFKATIYTKPTSSEVVNPFG